MKLNMFNINFPNSTDYTVVVHSKVKGFIEAHLGKRLYFISCIQQKVNELNDGDHQLIRKLADLIDVSQRPAVGGECYYHLGALLCC